MPLADVQKIIGPTKADVPSKPLHLLWVWGYDKNHGPALTIMNACAQFVLRLIQERAESDG